MRVTVSVRESRQMVRTLASRCPWFTPPIDHTVTIHLIASVGSLLSVHGVPERSGNSRRDRGRSYGHLG